MFYQRKNHLSFFFRYLPMIEWQNHKHLDEPPHISNTSHFVDGAPDLCLSLFSEFWKCRNRKRVPRWNGKLAKHWTMDIPHHIGDTPHPVDGAPDLCLHLLLKPSQPHPLGQQQGGGVRRRWKRGERKPPLLWHLKVCRAWSKIRKLQEC